MSHVLPSPGPRKRFSERLEDVAIVMYLNDLAPVGRRATGGRDW
jgi:hypothetical protein